MTRIVILGGPKTGKTTLAGGLQRDLTNYFGPLSTGQVRHTDDLIHLGWSEASQAAALWLDEPGPWIIEGVAVVRALRKWRDAHPGAAPPVDRVIRLATPLPHVEISSGQAAMAKGEYTIWREIRAWLIDHGIEIDVRDPGGSLD